MYLSSFNKLPERFQVMKEIQSFSVTISLLTLAYVFLHYLILFFGFGDLAALLLFSLPVISVIAYATTESKADSIRAACKIFG
ncbi:MAG: hypothetical protein ACI9KN_000445 [Gammaproteobacteria bacterium]|jgi:hypothetical protein